jgi:hypothetical protein
MTDDIPVHLVAAIDQGFAQAQDRLSELLDNLISDIADRGGKGDALPWAASVMYILHSYAAQGTVLPTPLVEVWQAALYRLAHQQIASAAAEAERE